MNPTPNNTKFFAAASLAAMLITTVMLCLTSRQVHQNGVKQNKINHRIDSINNANRSFEHQRDSIKFNRSNHFIDHSKL